MPPLHDLPLRAKVVLGGLAALLLLAPALAALTGDVYLLRLAQRVVIYGLAAAALDLVLGVAGLVSFGHGAFLGLGAYVVGIAFTHGFEGSTFLGLEPSQDLLVLAPLAMLFFSFVSLERYNGDDGVALWTRNDLRGTALAADETWFYFLALACLLLYLLLGLRALDARFGRVLRAAKENERRMLTLGFAVQRYRLVAFVLSGAVTGLAGVLLANQTYFVSPAAMSWQSSGHLIVMVVLGGLGTLIGPVLGAAAFLLLEDLTPPLMDLLVPGFGQHWKLLLGPILIGVALVARRGLLGLLLGTDRG